MLIIFLIFQSDSEVMTSIWVALESIHAALAVMANVDMPKQIYKEEVCYVHIKALSKLF